MNTSDLMIGKRCRVELNLRSIHCLMLRESLMNAKWEDCFTSNRVILQNTLSIFMQIPLNLSPTCLKWQRDALTNVGCLETTRIFISLFPTVPSTLV
jgi:hypothetical protein